MTEPRAEEGFDDPFEDDAFDDAVDPEAPEADMIEQHTSTREDRGRSSRRNAPLEADDADAAEQDREDVFDDEDDYR